MEEPVFSRVTLTGGTVDSLQGSGPLAQAPVQVQSLQNPRGQGSPANAMAWWEGERFGKQCKALLVLEGDPSMSEVTTFLVTDAHLEQM